MIHMFHDDLGQDALALAHVDPAGGAVSPALTPHQVQADLEFVKKFTRPNFRPKEFYTLKTRKLRLFSPAINSDNASLSVIWASFG